MSILRIKVQHDGKFNDNNKRRLQHVDRFILKVTRLVRQNTPYIVRRLIGIPDSKCKS